MRLPCSWHLLLLCVITVPALSQIHPHFGVELGAPINDTLLSTDYSSNSDRGIFANIDRYNSKDKRLLVGPVFRVDLARGFGFEFDALYQRVDYDHFIASISNNSLHRSFEQTKGDRWQFPLLTQYTSSCGVYDRLWKRV